MSAFSITIPRLETERLLLCAYRQADFDAFAAVYETPRSGFIGGSMPRALAWRGLATHLGHWALRGFGFRAVAEKATGAFCGHVGLWHPEGWPGPEVGWVLMGPAEGRGLAPEAALAARRHAQSGPTFDLSQSTRFKFMFLRAFHSKKPLRTFWNAL